MELWLYELFHGVSEIAACGKQQNGKTKRLPELKIKTKYLVLGVK